MISEIATQRPRLAILGSTSGRSGVPSYIEAMCHALRDQARITVFAAAPGPGFEFCAREGIDFRCVPALSRHGLRAPGRGLRDLHRALDGVQPDIVWAHSWKPITLARLLARRGHIRQLVATCHGAPFGPGRRLSAPLRAFEAYMLRRGPSQGMLFVTERDRAAYAPFLAGHHSWLVPNASFLVKQADLPPPAAAGPRPRLIMTGRVAHQKNPEAAMAIFARLPDDWEMVLAGQGTDAPKFKDRMRRLVPGDQTDRLRFAGPLAPGALAAELAAADLLMMTSRYEGMPIGALEAFECGVPLALTDVGGTQEIVAAHPMATVIAPDRPAEAAGRITELVRRLRADRAGLMASNRAAWQKAFAPELWDVRMRAVFSEICQAGPARA